MNPLDIRLHLGHRLSIALIGTVYCRPCDYYLTDLESVAIELNPETRVIDVVVLTPLRIGEGR